MRLTPEERRELRPAGRRAAAALPDISPESAARIAALIAEPLNAYAKTMTK